MVLVVVACMGLWLGLLGLAVLLPLQVAQISFEEKHASIHLMPAITQRMFPSPWMHMKEEGAWFDQGGPHIKVEFWISLHPSSQIPTTVSHPETTPTAKQIPAPQRGANIKEKENGGKMRKYC